MPRFVKNPVKIEAHLWDGDQDAITDWIASTETVHRLNTPDAALVSFPSPKRLLVHTLEGDMEAGLGDWIIRGIEGELYPCKPEIFERTYTLVVDPEVHMREVEEQARALRPEDAA